MSACGRILGMKNLNMIDVTTECHIKVESHKLDVKPHLILTRKGLSGKSEK